MLGTSKPLASLSSGLLARKGQAKPAMRPQGFAGFGQTQAAALDDLGWNDMGSEPAPVQPVVVPVTSDAGRPAPAVAPVAAPPAVVALHEALVERVATPAPVDAEPVAPVPTKSVSVATATRLRRESVKQTTRGKAAFTLRLDGERHLRLRLASALAGRSAQMLVTDAVDGFLRTMPEVDALIAQLPEPKRGGKGRG